MTDVREIVAKTIAEAENAALSDEEYMNLTERYVFEFAVFVAVYNHTDLSQRAVHLLSELVTEIQTGAFKRTVNA